MAQQVFCIMGEIDFKKFDNPTEISNSGTAIIKAFQSFYDGIVADGIDCKVFLLLPDRAVSNKFHLTAGFGSAQDRIKVYGNHMLNHDRTFGTGGRPGPLSGLQVKTGFSEVTSMIYAGAKPQPSAH